MTFQITVKRNEALLSQKWLNICLATGISDLIPYFAFLACAAFPLPSTLSLSQPPSLLTFTFPILFPVLLGEERVRVKCLAAYWG